MQLQHNTITKPHIHLQISQQWHASSSDSSSCRKPNLDLNTLMTIKYSNPSTHPVSVAVASTGGLIICCPERSSSGSVIKWGYGSWMKLPRSGFLIAFVIRSHYSNCPTDLSINPGLKPYSSISKCGIWIIRKTMTRLNYFLQGCNTWHWTKIFPLHTDMWWAVHGNRWQKRSFWILETGGATLPLSCNSS